MKGTVYFKDGHTEEILALYDYVEGKSLVQFKTESGRYLYDGVANRYYRRVMINDPSEGIIPVYFVADDIEHVDLAKTI